MGIILDLQSRHKTAEVSQKHTTSQCTSPTIDLPSILNLPKDTSCLWLLDLPEEIINEIILLVPLIDLFRVSKVNKLFQVLAYKRIIIITTENEYEKAAEKGDILSLINCSLPYWYNGLEGGCKKRHVDIVHLMISKAESHPVVYKKYTREETRWNWGLRGACFGGHMDMVQLMIEKGANDWNLVLSDACQGGHMDIVQFLINKGANNWNWGLQGACLGSHKDLNSNHLCLHLSEGPNTKCPLANQEARNEKHFLEIVQLMISKGATRCNCGKSLYEHQ